MIYLNISFLQVLKKQFYVLVVIEKNPNSDLTKLNHSLRVVKSAYLCNKVGLFGVSRK